jgi:uncharacterized protein YggE
VAAGTGSAAVKRQAEVLRMEVDLMAQAKDIDAAMAKLKQMRDGAREQIAQMGADPGSISLGGAHVYVDPNERNRQMQRAMQMRSSGRRAPTSAPALPITLASALKAEWQLKPGSPDESLVLSQTLKQKVTDLIQSLKQKANDAAKSAAEEEQEEENSADMQISYNDGSSTAGEPAFLFVAKVTPEEQAKAAADAFQKARSQAEMLAKAAGAEIGAVRSLSTTVTSAGPSSFGGYYNSYAQQMVYRMAQGQSSEAMEAVGTDPGSVQVTITVVASFTVK